MSFNNKSLRENYDDLIANKIPFFVYNYHGTREGFLENYPSLHILSGSFNPIHDIHKLIYKSMIGKITTMPRFVRQVATYEICLCPRGKDCLSFEELKTRLNQFNNNEKVIITNCTFFRDKAKMLAPHKIFVHIGYDTGVRLLTDDGFDGIQAINAVFYIYSRDDKGIEQLEKIPTNFVQGEYWGAYTNGISSTKMRNENS